MWIKWKRPCRSVAAICKSYFSLSAELPRLHSGPPAIFVLPSHGVVILILIGNIRFGHLFACALATALHDLAPSNVDLANKGLQ